MLNSATIKAALISFILPFLAATIGGIFTGSSVSGWYKTIEKPLWTPPGSTIGLVWTTLFILIGVSLFLILRKGFEHPGVKLALTIFVVQIVLNILWSFCFFYLKSPAAGMAEIIVLWMAILVNVVVFYRLMPLAAFLLVPYLAWVAFAAYLNFTIWRMNS